MNQQQQGTLAMCLGISNDAANALSMNKWALWSWGTSCWSNCGSSITFAKMVRYNGNNALRRIRRKCGWEDPVGHDGGMPRWRQGLLSYAKGLSAVMGPLLSLAAANGAAIPTEDPNATTTTKKQHRPFTTEDLGNGTVSTV